MKTSRFVAVLVVLSSIGVAGAASATVERAGRTSERLVAHETPTGNRAVIAYFRQVVAATRAADGAEYTYSASAPLDRLKLLPKGGWSVYSWSWPHPGYYPIDDTFFVGASHGRITFVTDTMTWGGHGPTFSPFGEVLSSRGEVELFGGAVATTTPPQHQTIMQPCDGLVHGPVASYTKVGVPSGYGLGGDFRSMKRVGPNEVVISTYPAGKGHVATETDVIDRATDLPLSGTTVVSGTPGEPAFTMHWSVAWYHTPLYLPRTDGVCASISAGVAV